jgi:hypothetical protein
MSLKSSFVSYLNQKYPELSPEQLNPLVSDQLLSPFQVTLSKNQIEQIKTEVNAYWNLRSWGESHLAERYSSLNLRKPNNYSVCMSYDFHINSEGKPELIEVNTNASFLALGIELYSFLSLKNPMGSFAEQDLVQMFLNELGLSGAQDNSIAIVDENPELQRLYLEFLVFKNLLNKNNIKTEIFDINKLSDFKDFSLVYNRYTDFYLQEEKSHKIKKLYNENKLQLSPQPYDYFLLADKERLLDWNEQTEVSKPESLLKTYDLKKADRDQIWNERKNLFFKPKTSFGGKQAYKGASISRKIFDEVFNEKFIAQRLSVPSHIEVEFNGEKIQLKYDLRCYAYKNETQLIIARLYQGQTTNLKTTGGGFACVIVQ